MRRTQSTGGSLLALGLTVSTVFGGACAGGSPADNNGGQVQGGTAGMLPLPTGGMGVPTGGMGVPTGGTIAATGGAGGVAGTMVVPTGGAGAGGMMAATGGMMAATGGMMAATGGMMAGMGGAGGAAGGGPSGSECLDGITSFGAAGPFTFSAETAGSVKMWIPDVPAGCKVPVIHLANGTGGTCGSYRVVHERFASHGFLATCYESGSTGAGTQGIMALETAYSMYPDLAGDMIGSTGHSQGGQAAFIVLQFAEAKWGTEKIYTGLAMQPASGFGSQPAGGTWQSYYGMIKSPMFMFSGTSDGLVSERWVAQAQAALDPSIESYNWSAVGATHVPVPAAETAEVGIPWFRWKLLGDNEACKAFKALDGGGNWNSIKEQNPVSCL